MGIRKDLEHIPRSMHRGSVIFCVKCLLYLSRDSFYKNTVSKTKRSSWCKGCTKSYYRQKRIKNANARQE